MPDNFCKYKFFSTKTKLALSIFQPHDVLALVRHDA